MKRGQHVRSTDFPGVALWFIATSKEEPDWSIVRMVGDDQDHQVETSTLSRLKDSEFCPGCGQIGCTAYGTG